MKTSAWREKEEIISHWNESHCFFILSRFSCRTAQPAGRPRFPTRLQLIRLRISLSSQPRYLIARINFCPNRERWVLKLLAQCNYLSGTKRYFGMPAVYGCALVTAEWKKNNIRRLYTFLVTPPGGFTSVPNIHGVSVLVLKSNGWI